VRAAFFVLGGMELLAVGPRDMGPGPVSRFPRTKGTGPVAHFPDVVGCW
jgi:hypothetical protein